MTHIPPTTMKDLMNAQPEAIRIERVRNWFEDTGSRAEIATYSNDDLLGIAGRIENPGFWRTQKHNHWLANPFGQVLDRRELRLNWL